MLKDAEATRDRCEVTRYEAMVLRSWKATIGKPPAKRKELVTKHTTKFNALGVDPTMVQQSVWSAIQGILTE